MNKQDIRKKILAVRDSIPAMEKTRYDDEIRKRILTQSVYKKTQIILAYASYRSEVDTMALTRQAFKDGKDVFMPKVSGDDMEFWRITVLEDLRSGYRGILEPQESVSFPDWIAKKDRGNVCHVMMWMPGAVFDKERHRIGYGKGFYDRYLYRLAQQRNENGFVCGAEMHLTTAALAYSCQVLERIPYEPHDVRPDMVVTEETSFNGYL
ncbi:MAG: 5-formyltetrahydrofolate cyclo-ligase [Eubacterium sp.]|nr:5-formyltetrahydrofolate cyclo-ligase [Eubacterium sp.]